MQENYAIIFPKENEVAIEKKNMPKIKNGQVLIKTICSLISTGTEMTMLRNRGVEIGSVWSKIIKFPIHPGYSNIGRVADTAPDVDGLWIGKKVATWAPHASYVVCDSKMLRTVPEEIPEDEAAFFLSGRDCHEQHKEIRIVLG